MADRLVDILPPRVRRVVYALLGFASVVVPVLVAVLGDGFQAEDIPLILTGVAGGGGFTLASANTPR